MRYKCNAESLFGLPQDCHHITELNVEFDKGLYLVYHCNRRAIQIYITKGDISKSGSEAGNLAIRGVI